MQADRQLRVPTYRLHKASKQAIVTLDGRDFYLGKYRTRVSRQAYDRLIAEWAANGRQLPATAQDGLTLVELCAHYKRFAKRYYVTNGRLTNSYDHVVRVMQFLGSSPYGSTPVKDFGPLALKTLQTLMVGEGRSRDHVNRYTATIKRAIKWGVSEQLLPPSMFHAIQTVQGLQRGRTAAKEYEPVLPVGDAIVEATLPHLPPVVADMVRLQRFTGARPNEICILRPCDVNMAGDVWEYRPSEHKTQYRGRERTIFLGPQAQEVLRPYLLRDKNAFCFAPVESESSRNAARRADRRSPMTPSQAMRQPKTVRCRAPGRRYNHNSYRRAIHRAADIADREIRKKHPDHEILKRLIPRWSPNQLRHTAATAIRRRFGLEAAGTVLGHAKADVTQIYAERDFTLAAMVMREVG